MADDFLEERTRAEDILLGGLGFGEEASLVSIQRSDDGFSGVGKWADGESFEFESEESELTELECWALGVLLEGSLQKAS